MKNSWLKNSLQKNNSTNFDWNGHNNDDFIYVLRLFNFWFCFFHSFRRNILFYFISFMYIVSKSLEDKLFVLVLFDFFVLFSFHQFAYNFDNNSFVCFFNEKENYTLTQIPFVCKYIYHYSIASNVLILLLFFNLKNFKNQSTQLNIIIL